MKQTGNQMIKKQNTGQKMNKPQDFFREMYRADLGQCLDYLETERPELLPREKDYISGTVAMDASAQGYNGISSYNSVMNGYVKEFVETCCPELVFCGSEPLHLLEQCRREPSLRRSLEYAICFPDRKHHRKAGKPDRVEAFISMRMSLRQEPHIFVWHRGEHEGAVQRGKQR